MTKSEIKKDRMKKLQEYPIYLLVIWTAQIEEMVLERKKQGEVSNGNKNRSYNHLIQRRAVYRKALFNELSKWAKDPNYSGGEKERLTYSNVNKYDKLKNIVEEQSAKEMEAKGK